MVRTPLILFIYLTASIAAICPAMAASKNGSREIFLIPGKDALPPDGSLGDREIALTFDDGPDPNLTPKILETLRKYQVKAVFFEIGNAASLHPELTKEVLTQGHSLGSHSWDHRDLGPLPLPDALEDIRRGREAVDQAAGSGFHSTFFRFPSFSESPELQDNLKEMGLISFEASIFPDDWLTPDPKELLARSLAAVEAQNHGIILFHDIQPQTAAMLDGFLAELLARGFKTAVFRQKINGPSF